MRGNIASNVVDGVTSTNNRSGLGTGPPRILSEIMRSPERRGKCGGTLKRFDVSTSATPTVFGEKINTFEWARN
jgi:hypothetical protein